MKLEKMLRKVGTDFQSSNLGSYSLFLFIATQTARTPLLLDVAETRTR